MRMEQHEPPIRPEGRPQQDIIPPARRWHPPTVPSCIRPSPTRGNLCREAACIPSVQLSNCSTAHLGQILPVAVAQLPPSKQAAGAAQEGVPAAGTARVESWARGAGSLAMSRKNSSSRQLSAG